MNTNIKEKLEKNGWQVSDTKDFLGLSTEEMQLVELQTNCTQLYINGDKINDR